MIAQRFLRQGSFHAPTCIDSGLKSLESESSSRGPISHCQGFSVVRQPDIASAVPRLLMKRRPATIPRLIVSGVVDPIQRMAIARLWSHVGQKVRKRSAPSFAHLNSTGTVVAIIGIVRRMASIFGFLPTVIFTSLVAAMFPEIPGQLCLDAAAAHGLSSDHGRAFWISPSSAIAMGSPIQMAESSNWSARYGPSAKTLPDQVGWQYRHSELSHEAEDIG